MCIMCVPSTCGIPKKAWDHLEQRDGRELSCGNQILVFCRCSTQGAISVVSCLYYVDVVWAGEALQGSKYRIHLIYFLLINLYFNWDRSLYVSLSWSPTLISCLPHAGFTGFVWLRLSRGRVLHCSPGWLGTRPGWEMVQQVPGLQARNWQRL